MDNRFSFFLLEASRVLPNELFRRDDGAEDALVAFPRSTAEVKQILQLCTKHEIPVCAPHVPRSHMESGLRLSLSRMRKLLLVSSQSAVMCVEAGVREEDLLEYCKKSNLDFPARCKPSLAEVSLRRRILGATVVTMNGEQLELKRDIERKDGIDLIEFLFTKEPAGAILTEITLDLGQRDETRVRSAIVRGELLKGSDSSASAFRPHVFQAVRKAFDPSGLLRLGALE